MTDNVTPLRCRITELLVDQCACRIHRTRRFGSITPEWAPPKAPATVTPIRPDPFDTPGDAPAPWVPAAFQSECDECGSPIFEGDDIRADGSGGWEGRCCE